MANRPFQILIYPTAVIRSHKADEEQAQIAMMTSAAVSTSKAECTDAVVPLQKQPTLLIGGIS
jgi:hypothetical protein